MSVRHSREKVARRGRHGDRLGPASQAMDLKKNGILSDTVGVQPPVAPARTRSLARFRPWSEGATDQECLA